MLCIRKKKFLFHIHMFSKQYFQILQEHFVVLFSPTYKLNLSYLHLLNGIPAILYEKNACNMTFNHLICYNIY